MELRRRIEQLSPEKRLVLLRKLRAGGNPVAITWAQDLAARDALPDLALEAYLDPAIQPAPDLPAPSGASRTFVTGATGFLGAFLLRELTRDPERQVSALVRCDSEAAGAQRLRENLARYGLLQQVDLARVRVIPGKLDALRLGLAEEDFRALAGETDVIFHCGALLNFLYGYQPFVGPNVVGTQEVLRLACTGPPKRINHVSTVFSFMSGPHPPDPPPVDETSARITPPGIWGGYAQSKWVSERLVWIAAERGLPVSVFRLGLVAGSSETGACSREEILVRYMEGLPRLGVYPVFPFHLTIEVGCVDFCARAIAALGVRDSARGRAFHLHTEEPGEQHMLAAQLLLDRSLSLRPVRYPEWLDLLRRQVIKQRDNALQPLVPFLAEPWPGTTWTFHETLVHRPRISATETLRELATLGIHCPSPVEAGRKTLDWLSG